MYGGRHKPSAEKPNLTNVEFDPAYTGVQCYKHLKMCFDYCDDYAYAYTFTTAAFDGVNTSFSSGRLYPTRPRAPGSPPPRSCGSSCWA